MFTLVVMIHVLVCLFLIIVVLLQSGKAADLAGAFGGMGSQTAFGPRGSATLLSKATTVSAVVFMLTSLTLSILATRSGPATSSTVLEKSGAPKQSAPAQPGAPKTGQPVTPAQTPAAPAGQPAVTVEMEGGGKQTIPLTVPQQGGQQQPQKPAPGQGQKK